MHCVAAATKLVCLSRFISQFQVSSVVFPQVHNDEDGNEGSVNYENVGEPSASVRLPRKMRE